jgi:hypothetical protein
MTKVQVVTLNGKEMIRQPFEGEKPPPVVLDFDLRGNDVLYIAVEKATPPRS